MERVTKAIEASRLEFRSMLEKLRDTAGLTPEIYVRYLSLQFYLNRNNQQHFLRAVSHPDFSRRRGLRKFLVEFANEEELHFEVAQQDIEALGAKVMPCPLEAELWWAYFDRYIQDRPFVRLGAACLLENIAEGSLDIIEGLFRNATFLTPKNSVYFTIHLHGKELPHGTQFLNALKETDLEERHVLDLLQGAEAATRLYLLGVGWAITPRP